MVEADLQREIELCLLEKGLIDTIKPPIRDLTPWSNRKSVKVEGQPISEMLIEERR